MHLKLGGSGDVAREVAAGDLAGLPGQQVGQHGDAAHAAHGQDRHDLIVVAGVEVQLAVHQGHGLHDGGDVAVGLLDGLNVLVRGQAQVGGGLDVAAGAGGHVVQDQRLGARVCDGHEGAVQALLGGLVVVGGDHQHRVRADRACKLRQLHGVGRVVAAGARDHRNAAVGALHGVAHDLLVLRVAQGRALAGGAAADDCVDAAVDLPVDQPSVCVVIHLAACGEGGDECGGDALEDALVHGDFLLLYISSVAMRFSPESPRPHPARTHRS